jgi:hypothetical protein
MKLADTVAQYWFRADLNQLYTLVATKTLSGHLQNLISLKHSKKCGSILTRIRKVLPDINT